MQVAGLNESVDRIHVRTTEPVNSNANALVEVWTDLGIENLARIEAMLGAPDAVLPDSPIRQEPTSVSLNVVGSDVR
jgi:hypothetical protein